jgi:hypothetical protein
MAPLAIACLSWQSKGPPMSLLKSKDMSSCGYAKELCPTQLKG